MRVFTAFLSEHLIHPLCEQYASDTFYKVEENEWEYADRYPLRYRDAFGEVEILYEQKLRAPENVDREQIQE